MEFYFVPVEARLDSYAREDRAHLGDDNALLDWGLAIDVGGQLEVVFCDGLARRYPGAYPTPYEWGITLNEAVRWLRAHGREREAERFRMLYED